MARSQALRQDAEADPPASPGPHAPLAATLVLILLGLLTINDLATQVIGHAADVVVGPLKDLVVAALIVLAAVAWRRGVRPPMSLLVAVAAIWILSAVAALQSLSPTVAAYGFRSSYWGLALLVVLPMLLTSAEALRVIRMAVLLGQAAAAFAVVTWSFGLDWLSSVVDRLPSGLYQTSYFVAGSLRPRAFSPYVSPNTLGLVMAALCVAVLAAWPHMRFGRLKPAYLLVLPLAALTLSQSRSALLDLFAGAAVILLARFAGARRRPVPGVAVVAFALMAFTLGLLTYRMLSSPSSGYGPDPLQGSDKPGHSQSHSHKSGGIFGEPSAEGHVRSLNQATSELAGDVWGVGLGMVGPRALTRVPNATQVEGSFLLVGLEIGVLGLVCYLAMLAALAWLGIRRAGPGRANVPLLATAVVAVLAPSQMLLPSVQEITAMWLCWSLAGAALVTAQVTDGRDQ